MREKKKLLADVGSGVRRWRKKAGWTMAQLAEQAGIDTGFLAYIETGRKLPSLTTAAKLADALDIGLTDLFSDVHPRWPNPDYEIERQVVALLHACSKEQKAALLSILKGLRDPKRLEALRRLLKT
ncbi:MAG: helix-turn-helix transcriptional regulator [Elusimicrobiota bacterium]